MAGRGETVKYYIDADTSGFVRGMAESALASEGAERRINKSLSSTSKRSENNFNDIRRNAATAASSIRNFGVAMQGFNTTSAIIAVTALSGALIELSGAIAAAGTTVLVIAPAISQFASASLAAQTGMYGLGDAFKAIEKNDPKAFTESMSKLGPAAQEVARAVGGLNNAMNGLRLNTQQALLDGVGDSLLKLGSQTLPTVNAGFQIIGQAMNRAFKQAASLAGSPAFSGLMARVFQDTARAIDTLSGAMGPLLTIFTKLYLITAPYTQLFYQWIVSLSNAGAAYISTAKGQTALNMAIAEGVIALQQIGSLVRAVFGFLTSVFRTSVVSGTSLITTIVGIVDNMTAWVNSAKGQVQLAALFQFTALTVNTVASALGSALTFFFGIIQAVNSLNPALQQMIVGFLSSALVIRPILSYFSQLYLAIRVVAVTIFNFAQQALVVARALGTVASVGLLLAGGLILLGTVIKGPLGSAFIVIGAAIAAFIGLNYLLSVASTAAAGAMLRQGYSAVYASALQAQLAGMNGILAATMLSVAGAATAAGGGMSFAARAAIFLQSALIPLLILAAGIGIILGMLGVFSQKAGQAQSSSDGLTGSMTALQKSLKSVGSTGSGMTKGVSALNTSLKSVGDSAQGAQNGLAAFDKMNVLSDASANAASGIPGLPAVPSAPNLGGLGGGAIAMPDLDTKDFDKSITEMQDNFNKMRKDIESPITNPFDSIGKFIAANPVPFFIAFAVVIALVAAAFILMGVGVNIAISPLTLIVIAIVAIIAIIVLLVQNWTAIWATIQTIISNAGKVIGDIFTNIGNFFATVFGAIWAGIQGFVGLCIEIFKVAFSVVTTVWGAIVDFFSGLWNNVVAGVSWLIGRIVDFFKLAWLGVQIIWTAVVGWFQGVWNGIVNVFAVVGKWFIDTFSGAWEGIKRIFDAVGGFFRGVWDSIVNIFTSIGTAIGNAIGGAFKNVVNSIIGFAENTINMFIRAINSAISLINNIPGVKISTLTELKIPRLARGGVVSQPTVAQIGEAGEEAVMPLENNTEWIDKLASKINGSSNNNPDIIPVTNTREQPTTQLNINVSGVLATSEQDKRRLAEMIAKQLESSLRAKGLRGTL